MSSNNLYAQLIDLATQQQIQFSQQPQTQRASEIESCPAFTSKLKQIKQKTQNIHLNNQKILRFKNKIAHNALPSSQTQIYNSIRILCDENYDSILQLRKNFEQLTDIVKKNAQQRPDEPQTNSQVYQKQYIGKQVQNIISQTQKIQLLIQKFQINTSLKRIKALAPEMDDSQAEQIAKKKNGYDQLVMEKTLGKASLRMKYRVQDITQKNKQISKLQKIVEENLQLMQQIAVMVKQQGQMIENIHDNVLNAKDYIEKAENILHKQKKQHKKSRKKICCIILLAIVILALVVTPIVLTIVNENKKT